MLKETSILPEIPNWTREQYFTPEPFEWLYNYRDNKFVLVQLRDLIREKCGEVGIKNFGAKWDAFLTEKNKQNKMVSENSTDYEGQPRELFCGEYTCDDNGVSYFNNKGEQIIVCRHPIMIVQRLTNVDSGEEKLELAYKRSGDWRFKIFDKSTLANASKIVELAKYGISVDSESAKELVRFLSMLEDENYDEIPQTSSVGRLGWIGDYGFSPFVDNLKFDGDICYQHMFDSVKESGSFEAWLELTRTIRDQDNIPKIMLASSFASALVEPLGGLPFFTHVWGGTEAGKTVGLMLAASVWANPALGSYIHTFNSTTVGQEMMASFCNSMPLCLDELQCIKDRRDFDKLIYMLTEGIGKGRGAKSGGLQRVNTWKNCIITTGEQPITTNASGGGAVNRIIEIDCKGEKLFHDPQLVADTVRANYGFAGKVFVEHLKENLEEVNHIFKNYYSVLQESDSTEKQAMAGALILTADYLSEMWIFRDGNNIQPEELVKFLTSKEDVDVNARAVSWITDWVASNQQHFDPNNDNTEHWGIVRDGYICIINNVFEKAMYEEGFNASSFLSWAERHRLLDTEPGRNTKKRLIGDMRPRCVCIKQDVEPKEKKIEMLN